jgi:hypothetical protein
MRTSTLSHVNLQSKAGGDEVRAEGIRRALPSGYWFLRVGLLGAYKTESVLVGCSPVALVSTRAEPTLVRPVPAEIVSKNV